MGSVTDPQVLQLLRILEEEGNDLAQRDGAEWERLTLEATHTTIANENQGAITTIASNGFRFFKNDTFWDRTSKLPVIGPLSDQEWQIRKGLDWSGPRYIFRIRGGNLLVNPVPTAGLSWAFEYVSKNWILGADLTTYKQYFTLDTDTILLPEELVLMGLRWRWKKEKGLEYAEDLRTYEMQVHDAIGRDGAKPVLNMNYDARTRQPGIFVPDRNWPIP
jgi:hypothetical protein